MIQSERVSEKGRMRANMEKLSGRVPEKSRISRSVATSEKYLQPVEKIPQPVDKIPQSVATGYKKRQLVKKIPQSVATSGRPVASG